MNKEVLNVAGTLNKSAREFARDDQPEPPRRTQKPNGNCPQCDGSGLVPVCWTFARPHARRYPDGSPLSHKSIVEVTCDCDDGAWLRDWTFLGKSLPTLSWCRREGVVDSSAKTRTAHWLYAQWIIHQHYGLDTSMLEAIERGANRQELLTMLAKRVAEYEAKHPDQFNVIGSLLKGRRI